MNEQQLKQLIVQADHGDSPSSRRLDVLTIRRLAQQRMGRQKACLVALTSGAVVLACVATLWWPTSSDIGSHDAMTELAVPIGEETEEREDAQSTESVDALLARAVKLRQQVEADLRASRSIRLSQSKSDIDDVSVISLAMADYLHDTGHRERARDELLRIRKRYPLSFAAPLAAERLAKWEINSNEPTSQDALDEEIQDADT